MAISDGRHERDLKVFGGPEALAAVDEYVNRIADAAPQLTPWQRSRLRVLLRTPVSEIAPPASSASTAA